MTKKLIFSLLFIFQMATISPLSTPRFRHHTAYRADRESDLDYDEKVYLLAAVDFSDGQCQPCPCPDSGAALSTLRIGKVISIMTKKLVFSLVLIFQMAAISPLGAQIPAPHCLPCGSGNKPVAIDGLA